MIVKSQECENRSFLHLEGLHPCLQSIAMVHVFFSWEYRGFFGTSEKTSMLQVILVIPSGALILGQPHGAIGGASIGQGLSYSVSRRCDARSNHWFNSSTLNEITKDISIVNIVSTPCLERT